MPSEKVNALKAKLRLLNKALLPRFLFILHGFICTEFIVWSEKDSRYWWLLSCLGIIVIEGILNVLLNDGKEFHWFCPSAFLYCIVLIIPLTALRLTQMNTLMGVGKVRTFNASDPTDHFTTDFLFRGKSYSQRISFIEQTGMGALIIGRWALPKGTISKEQFLQIVLIYIGTAADILELSEIYDEDIGSMQHPMILGVYYGTISVWALSISQFAMTIALPEKGLKDLGDENDTNSYDKGGPNFFRTKHTNKVAPMSYMHYKSMLREKVQNGPPISLQPPRGASFPNEIHTINFKNNMLKVASQNNAMKHSNSSLSLPSTNSHDKLVGRNEMTKGPSNLKKKISKTKSLDIPKSLDKNVNEKPHERPSNLKKKTSESKSLDAPRSPLATSKEATIIEFTDKPSSSSSSRSRESLTRKSLKTNSPIPLVNGSAHRNSSTIGTRNIWREALNQYSTSKQKNANKKKEREAAARTLSENDGKNGCTTCFEKYFDMIEMLHPVLMQDGPFFILRIVLLTHFQVSTDMTYLLLGKNFLVIVVSIYRMLLMYCSEPKLNESDHGNDDANRLRVAMDSNRRLSELQALRSRQEYLSMYVLNTMQSETNNSRLRNNSALSRS